MSANSFALLAGDDDEPQQRQQPQKKEKKPVKKFEKPTAGEGAKRIPGGGRADRGRGGGSHSRGGKGRGGGRGKGGRGREFDRKSQGGKGTGERANKKEGHGRFNWGDKEDDSQAQQAPDAEAAPARVPRELSDEEKEEAAAALAAAEAEARAVTLEEYRQQQLDARPEEDKARQIRAPTGDFKGEAGEVFEVAKKGEEESYGGVVGGGKKLKKKGGKKAKKLMHMSEFASAAPKGNKGPAMATDIRKTQQRGKKGGPVNVSNESDFPALG